MSREKTEVTHEAGRGFDITWPDVLNPKPLAEVQISRSVTARVWELTVREYQRHVNGEPIYDTRTAYRIAFKSSRSGKVPAALHGWYGNDRNVWTLIDVRLALEAAAAAMVPRSRAIREDLDPED